MGERHAGEDEGEAHRCAQRAGVVAVDRWWSQMVVVVEREAVARVGAFIAG